MHYFFTILWLASIVACSPATSDVYVETVNPELVNRLIAQANDTTGITSGAGEKAPPFWVSGIKLSFDNPLDVTYIWYDEQKRVTGLVEYQQGILKDSIQFFPNGQRIFSFLFNNHGKISGPARYFYDNGRVREEGRFENGIKTGIWRLFRPDGTLDMVNEYDRYGKAKR